MKTPSLVLWRVLAVTVLACSCRALPVLAEPHLEAELQKTAQDFVEAKQFQECVSFLDAQLKDADTAAKPVVHYLKAWCRYQQLRFLEETQSWDEYFSQGNEYRVQLEEAAEAALSRATATDPFLLRTRLLLWRYHHAQQDLLREESLESLMAAAQEFGQGTGAVEVLKEAADELAAENEKAKAKILYRLYARQLLAQPRAQEEIRFGAETFLSQGNYELAQLFVEAYLEKLKGPEDKEKLLQALADFAGRFAVSPVSAGDPAYAEKLYQQLQDLGGDAAVTEDLLYARGYNLEKAKEFIAAGKVYASFLERFAVSRRADEIAFKVGYINAYAGRDSVSAIERFRRLAALFLEEPAAVSTEASSRTASPQVVSAIYQLGLLHHYQEKLKEAQGYYERVLALAEKARAALPSSSPEPYAETVALARERIAELKEVRPIEYNLRTFLEATFQEEYTALDGSLLSVRCLPYRCGTDKQVQISASAFPGQSGCMQVDVQYLWSGHLGRDKTVESAASFSADYAHTGTKEIQLVVVSAAGILDRGFDLVDIE